MRPLRPLGLDGSACGDGGVEAGAEGAGIITADVHSLYLVRMRAVSGWISYGKIWDHERVERRILALDGGLP